MKYISLCSGIEAATVAWHPMGWSPLCFSEIERFPSAVLSHRHPKTPNHGDMTRFKEWPNYEPELLVGGTPCQSFSVAGLRKGLADPRGNLMLTYLAIAAKYRPKWLVWENVPGVLSSNGGRDFGALLGGLAKLGYGFAYRVLDAQYVRVESHPFAVPQRRRRVFVVGHFGDWRRAAAVLFERQSLRWHHPPCRKAGQGIASESYGGSDSSGECAAGLRTKRPGEGGISGDDTHLIPVSPALNTQSGGHHAPDTKAYVVDVAPTLNAHFGSKQRQENQHVDGGCGLFAARTLLGKSNSSHAEDADTYVTAFAHQQGGSIDLHMSVDVALSLQKSQGQAVMNQGVRRLTPTECERLQGFPGGYTEIFSNKNPDWPRYKALGNSMAVNCMRWIGERIQKVESIPSLPIC